jgi:hypothetical protein
MSYYSGDADQIAARQSAVGCAMTIGFALGFALVLIGLSAIVAPYYTTQLWWYIRESLFVWIPLVIVIILAVTAIRFDRKTHPRRAFGALAAASFLGTIVFWTSHSYLEHRAYTSSIHVTTQPVPALSVRSPFNVAEKQASADLGDTVGDINTTMYLPDQRRFTTLVAQKGAISGYSTLLVQDIGDTGRNGHELCEFSSAASRRFGGLFSSSLERYINEHERFVSWDGEDVYGYCDHGHPMVATPLKQQSGVFVVTERPAGIALYHGDTGELEIVTDPAHIAKIPGPTYPLSIAAYQRESTQAMNGFWNYFWNRSGWELPSDLNDINSDNIGEYVLANNAGAPTYVTLLTPRGGNTSVAAISTTPARLTTPGELASLTIHRTHWLSPQSIEQRIRANFGPVFTAQPGATIAELAPVNETEWVATIGLPQNMLYRVTGLGDLTTDLCLHQLDGRILQCGPMTNVNGYGPGAAIGPSTQEVPAGSDLHGLSTPQLTDLINRASSELASRASH